MNNNNNLEWRRSKVSELASKGYNQSEISRILQISQPTINIDISYLRQQAKQNIKRYIDERLPEEYEKCLVGLNAILREAWNTAQNTEDKREKIQALSLAKECYSMKLELLTNATVGEATSYNDTFDAFRLALKFYHFRDSSEYD
jgi:predicted transcriptional regulator